MRALAPFLMLSIAGCEDGLNLFTIEDDIELGLQLRDEINADPKGFPVVDRADAPEAYGHLDRMLNAVLNSGEVEFADDFAWEIYLIDDDETLNAFAAPGGYLWVYTGLMGFLEVEDDFVGVLGHEVAHADRRHSTEQLTQQYGLDVLLEIVFGESPGVVGELAAGLAGLGFSRADESEADEFSVQYLCQTDYAANGAAGFFSKLVEKGATEVPEFLSTHPSSANRVDDINAIAQQLGCSTEPNPNVPAWSEVLASLP